MDRTPPSRVCFIGSKAFGLACVTQMIAANSRMVVGVVTIDDREDPRSVLPNFKKLCAGAGLPLTVLSKSSGLSAVIAKMRPDLVIVVGWYSLISKELIDSVPFGFIGIHHSLLPSYRGGAPLVWALIEGKKRVGSSLFSFTAGMDDGPLWAQVSVAVHRDDYIADVLARLELKMLKVFLTSYKKILAGKAKARPQRTRGMTFCGQRLPGDGCINWNQPAAVVLRFIRAQAEPYPGAFTYLQGEKLELWRAQSLAERWSGTPGQVAALRPDGVVVVCRSGEAILVTEVQRGTVRAPARQVLRSVRIRLGDRAIDNIPK